MDDRVRLASFALTCLLAGRVRLDDRLSVTADDVSPGWDGNSRRWRRPPVTATVRRLLELSLVESDNTATDKLLALAGGPGAVTAEMHALGFRGIEVRGSRREFARRPEHPNRASANAIASLLSSLQRGEVLQRQHRDVLWGFMARSRTGLRRLRGNLPPGTQQDRDSSDRRIHQ